MDEKEIKMNVVDEGHVYELHNLDEGIQTLTFVKKDVKEGSDDLETVLDGTTNEAVLQVLLHRLRVLDERLPDEFTKSAIISLEKALNSLYARTDERKARGVEGKRVA